MREIRGRRISMVLQDPQTSLNPVFSIGDQLREAIERRRKGASHAEIMKEAVAALRRVEIAAPEQRIGQYPHQMSGGMKQRVVGAIAISGEPEVLIADEPTTALDVTIQLQYLKLLKRLQAETGMAILFITHDFGVVGRMCDRVAVMYAGRIVECGPVTQVFEAPVASLHPGADRLGAQDDRRGRAAHHHRGPAAVADGPAGRLPLRLALRPMSSSAASTPIPAACAWATSIRPIAGRWRRRESVFFLVMGACRLHSRFRRLVAFRPRIAEKRSREVP